MSARPRRHLGSGVRLGRNRCPFCHLDLTLERQEWIACWSCLARHHARCWEESGRCVSCGEGRSLGTSEARAEPSLPLLRLVLAAVVAAVVLVAAAALTSRPDTPVASFVVPSVVEASPPLAPEPEQDTRTQSSSPVETVLEPVIEFSRALDEGDAAFDRGDFDAAVEAYAHALRIVPHAAAGWVGRGNARARQGDLQGGLADLEQALWLTRLDDPHRPLIETDRREIRQLLFPEELGEVTTPAQPWPEGFDEDSQRLLGDELPPRLRRLLDF